ncbi:AAA family ATPase [Allosaccharopolyspora coralli]|uniref:AAA family ATPase n=1 Tax=Allosaccharopolyspora coralli TaxID=2665642 RepID=A0A5Q3QG58_9PSEU|nr:AAA family ATPase [Allosaccharopolyspora coralli]
MHIDRRTLVVLAGLPGAGKSTLLTKLHTTTEVSVLDSEQVRRRLSAFLPERIPYRWYRCFVHVTHRLRIVRACLLVRAPVVVHDPSTCWIARAPFVLVGALTRRRRVFVWLHVEPALALAGQYERGRLIRSHAFRRHVVRVRRLDALLQGGSAPRGYHAVRVLTRDDVRHGLTLDVSGGDLRPDAPGWAGARAVGTVKVNTSVHREDSGASAESSSCE